MRFNADAFDRHLANIGQRVQWRRSFSCACVHPTSGQADPKHALCAGKGRLWDPPAETVVGIASQKVQMAWVQAGMYEQGDMVLSVPQNSPVYEAGQYDRIVMLNSTTVFSQPLQRGAPSERLLFRPERITRCFYLTGPTRQIAEAGLPSVAADGTLSWPNGGEPPAGGSYSLTGTKFDEYYIWDQLSSDRAEHSGMRLPKRIVARKFDLFGR